jgi:hypothetical protein
MKYTVVWQQTAEDELGRLRLDAVDRQAIADAADRIDQVLRHEPARLGIVQSNGSRCLVVGPLSVRFDVHPKDCLATVLTVWLSEVVE